MNSIKKNSDSVIQYLQNIKEAKDKLISVGVHIDDERILHIVLQGLPSEFHSFTYAMLTKNESVRFEELHNLMKTEEDLLKSAMDNSKEISLMAMAANKVPSSNFNNSSPTQFNGNRGQGRNQNRGRGGGRFQSYNRGGFNKGNSNQGHYNSVPNTGNFNNYNSNPQSFSNPSSRPTCQICYKSGHTAIDCYQRMNYVYQGRHPLAKLAAMTTTAPTTPHQTTWISNTGATDHFTPDLNNIPDNQAYTDSQLVSVGNGQQLPISHIGNSQLQTSSSIFNLLKVLHVPSMTSNLLSIHRFCCDNACSFHFDANRFQIQDLFTGNLIYKGFSKDGLYSIHGLSLPSWSSQVSSFLARSSSSCSASSMSYTARLSSAQQNASQLDLWHSRLGHPQTRVL